jgi:hypothetical protein
MRDPGETRRAATDESPALDRALASLPHFTPAAGFEDRVMAQVFTPAPMWIQQFRHWRDSLADTGRLRWLLGGLIGAAAVSMSALAAFVALNGAATRDSLGQFLTVVGLPIWRALLGFAAQVVADICVVAGSVAFPGGVWLAMGVGGCVTLMLDVWILLRLMQPARMVKLNEPR